MTHLLTHPRRRRRATGLLPVVALLLLAATGCTHVAPYEREYLARPGMDVAERERVVERFYAHVYDAREGAMGTTDTAGGGCGCN